MNEAFQIGDSVTFFNVPRYDRVARLLRWLGIADLKNPAQSFFVTSGSPLDFPLPQYIIGQWSGTTGIATCFHEGKLGCVSVYGMFDAEEFVSLIDPCTGLAETFGVVAKVEDTGDTTCTLGIRFTL